MKVNEIFLSIQGEGAYTGYPTLFVRFQGCNLKCKYCDTKNSIPFSGGVEMDSPSIIRKLEQKVGGDLNNYHVCLTGGEPMWQKDVIELANTLTRDYNCIVNIETNGTIERPKDLDSKILYTLDIKCPESSKTPYTTIRVMLENAYKSSLKNIEIKCVVGTLGDLHFVEDSILCLFNYRVPIIISPMNGEEADPDIIGHIVRRMSEFPNLYKGAKIGIQLHRYLEVQ